jgi:DNA modification methylase
VASKRATIKSLTPDPRNANKGSERGSGMLEQSLRNYGAGRSLLVDKHGVVIAGNKTLEAAASLGMDDIELVQTDGRKLVVVQRMDLDLSKDKKAKELAVADNRVAQVSLDWDADVLQQLIAEGADLSHLFTGDELAALQVEPEPVEGHTDPDDVPAERPTDIKPGDLFQLGRHRLLCGDSTLADTLDKLLDGELAHCIFTDPPYGVAYKGGMKKRTALANDHVGTNIYSEALPLLAGAADDHAALYLWYADGHAAAAAAAAAAAGYQIVAQIIWAKNHAQFVTSAHYKGKHEPCFYAHKKGQSARWHGPNNEVTLWEYSRSSSNDFHPTQKPVEIAARAIKNSTEPGQIVLDGFTGGGTTIIAAEQAGRRGYGVELEPSYCQVIIDRWEAFANAKAQKLGELVSQ